MPNLSQMDAFPFVFHTQIIVESFLAKLAFRSATRLHLTEPVSCFGIWSTVWMKLPISSTYVITSISVRSQSS